MEYRLKLIPTRPVMEFRIIGDNYEIDYDERQEHKKIKGKLLSADEDGFIVIEVSNGKKVLIPKDNVWSMTEM
jgi:hypothetical protein